MKYIKKWKSINESMSYDNVKISRNRKREKYVGNVLNESKGYLDEFYKEIDQDKFIEYVQAYNRITFDEKLYNKVTSLFINKPGIEWSGNYVNIKDTRRDINPWTVSDILSKTLNRKLTYGIDISVDDDEWFYVMVRGLEKTYFYKCDQIEGLRKLIEYYETY